MQSPLVHGSGSGIPGEATPRPVVEARHLVKHFETAERKQVLAVKDVDMTVHDHEFVCLLGPSGCGKSTILNMIAGYLKPSAGELLIEGKSVADPGPDRVMVFQDFALFPWRTVVGNVEFGLEMQGVPKRERREVARQFIELVGLSGSESKYPFQLSGGMRQRTAIARALAVNPQILLLDEPFGALDAQTRSIMQQELLRIWQQTRKTVLFVTHSISESVYLADRVIVMTASPGWFKGEVRIDMPRPRDHASPEFTTVAAQLEALLRSEVQSTLAREGVKT